MADTKQTKADRSNGIQDLGIVVRPCTAPHHTWNLARDLEIVLALVTVPEWS
jgi:hypothetical protein